MLEETCIFHPAQKAVAVCEVCGHSFCPVCLVNEGGRTLCRGCAEGPKTAPGGLEDLDHLLKKSPAMNDDPLGLLGASPSSAVPPTAPSREAATDPGSSTVPEAGPEPPKSAFPGMPASEPAPFRVPAPSKDGLSPETIPLRPMSSFGVGQPREASPWVVLWWRIEKWIKPLSRAIRVPVPLTAVFLGFLVLAILLFPLFLITGKPSVEILDTVVPVHLVKVEVSQVGELDITTYLEMENQLREIGFVPLVQLTLPQAPSPNFMSIYAKEKAGVYAGILKLPGVLAPKVAFITVFNNGVWCSTDGFAGKNVQDEFLSSTHHPDDPVDKLYVKHMQRMEQYKKQGWQVSRMGESRYVTALTDHFRWFLAKRKIPGYRASFDQWH